MGKANDKKVVKQAKETLVLALSNLLESARERKYQTRAGFVAQFGQNKSTVTNIETGRFLNHDFAQIRIYLGALTAKSNTKMATSFKKVYDGLKEIDELLKQL